MRDRQLNRERVPGRVAVEPVQVGTAQATGQAGQDERADDAGVAGEPDEQVRAIAGMQRVAAFAVDRRVEGEHNEVWSLAERQRQALDLGRLPVDGRVCGFADWEPFIRGRQATRDGVVQAGRRHVADMDAPDPRSSEDGREVGADPRAAVHDDGGMAARVEQFRRRFAGPSRQCGQLGGPAEVRAAASRKSVSAPRSPGDRACGQSRPASTSSRCNLATAAGTRSRRRATEQVPDGIGADALDHDPPGTHLELGLVRGPPEQPPRRRECGVQAG